VLLLGRVLLGIALLAGTACQRSAEDESEPVAGGTLRIAVFEPLGYLTPVEPLGRVQQELLDLVTPPLGWVDPQGRVQMRAARAWRERENIWDFFLPDLQWEDGVAVRPEDFRLTYQVCLHPAARPPWNGRYDFIHDVRALNDTTLRMTWNHLPPDRHRTGMLHPLPVHRLGDDPDVREFRSWPITERPLACGPFRATESTGSRLRLVRNATWTRTPVPLDGVDVQQMRQEDALQAFRRGALDVLEDVTADAVQALRDVSDKRTFALVGRSYLFLGWNLGDARARQRSTRVAAAHAVDLQRLIEATTLGQGEPARGPLLPIQGFADTTQTFDFDPAASRRLLQQAGWGDANQDGILDRRGVNLHFEILVDEGKPLHLQVASLVAEQFRDVGIGAELLPLPTVPFLQRLAEGRYEAFIGQWYPDLDANVEEVWRPGGWLNYTGYEDSHADSLLHALRYELNPENRDALMHELQVRIYQDQPYLFLVQPARFVIVSGRVRGVDPNVLSTFWNLPSWWIPRHLQ